MNICVSQTGVDTIIYALTYSSKTLLTYPLGWLLVYILPFSIKSFSIPRYLSQICMIYMWTTYRICSYKTLGAFAILLNIVFINDLVYLVYESKSTYVHWCVSSCFTSDFCKVLVFLLTFFSFVHCIFHITVLIPLISHTCISTLCPCNTPINKIRAKRKERREISSWKL